MSNSKSLGVSKSQRAGAPKKNPCNLWRQYGSCRFGNNCKFSHEANDYPINNINISEKDSMEETSVTWEQDVTPTTSVNSTGAADITTSPMLQRDLSGEQSGSSALGSNIGHAFARPKFPVKVGICKFWQAGRCNRGDNCHYRHDNEVAQATVYRSPSMAGISEERNIQRQRQKNTRIETIAAEAKARREEEERKQEIERREAERRENERLAKEEREVQKRQEEARRAELERRRQAERLETEREMQRQRKIQLETRWREEAAVVEQYVVLDSSLVTCGAGFDIRHIITGFELCRITIKNLPNNANWNEITDIFIHQGIPRAEFFLFQVRVVGNKKEAVVLANAEQGQTIALGLEGIEFRDEILSFDVSDNASWNAMGIAAQGNPFLTVNWKVPVETIIATYSSPDEARDHVRKLDSKTWKGRQIRAALDNYQGRGAFSRGFTNESTAVRITNCPSDAQSDPEFYNFAGSFNLRLLRSMPYDHQSSLSLVRQHLLSQSGVRMNTYEVLAIEEAMGEQKVKVQFDDWEDVKAAHNSIDKKKLGFGMTPFLRSWHPKPLQYSIKIPHRQYVAQKKQWDELSEKKPGSDAHIATRIGDRGDVFIRVLGTDKKAAGSLKVRVESMVAGETLDATHWHPSFMANWATRGLFDRIHASTTAHMRSDFKSRSLKVYGEAEVLEDVRRMIKEEVDRLANMETTRTLDRGFVGFFMREGLGRLKELLGEENVHLNLASRPCKITIKGGEEARHHLQRVIDEARAHSSLGAAQAAVEGETCPICYDNASHPEQLGCGHTYCSGCLKHFLTSAADTKTFPLACIGNDATCNVPISIPFIRRFLHSQAFQQLVEVAFNCYLEQHPQEMKYCTTPDCKQIYRRQTNKAMLQCPSCFSKICPACDEEAHEGMTCAERRLHRNPAEQERLNEALAAENGYKKCPECKVWIEKTEGCNHMACRCGAHICWRCMGVFSAGEIYQHMTTVHGNIYDQVPAGVAVGRAPNHAFLAEQVDALAQIERNRVARVALERRRTVQEAEERIRRLNEERRRILEQHAAENRRREEAERRRQAEQEAARRRLAQSWQANQTSYQQNRNTYIRTTPVPIQAKKEEGGWCVVM